MPVAVSGQTRSVNSITVRQGQFRSSRDSNVLRISDITRREPDWFLTRKIARRAASERQAGLADIEQRARQRGSVSLRHYLSFAAAPALLPNAHKSTLW